MPALALPAHPTRARRPLLLAGALDVRETRCRMLETRCRGVARLLRLGGGEVVATRALRRRGLPRV